MLQSAENAEGKDSSIENPRGSGIENPDYMMNTFSRNDEIHHVAGSPGISSDGGNSVTILNRFLNNGDVQHAAVPPGVSGNRSRLLEKSRETCSGDIVKRPERKK